WRVNQRGPLGSYGWNSIQMATALVIPPASAPKSTVTAPWRRPCGTLRRRGARGRVGAGVVTARGAPRKISGDEAPGGSLRSLAVPADRRHRGASFRDTAPLCAEHARPAAPP